MLSTRTTQYERRTNSSTKLTPMQTSMKRNKEVVFNNFKDKRKKHKPQFQLRKLIKTADFKKVLSKGDSTLWSYKINTITDVIHDTILLYRINYLPQRYSESLLKSIKLSLEEINQVMKNLNEIQ